MNFLSWVQIGWGSRCSVVAVELVVVTRFPYLESVQYEEILQSANGSLCPSSRRADPVLPIVDRPSSLLCGLCSWPHRLSLRRPCPRYVPALCAMFLCTYLFFAFQREKNLHEWLD